MFQKDYPNRIGKVGGHHRFTEPVCLHAPLISEEILVRVSTLLQEAGVIETGMRAGKPTGLGVGQLQKNSNYLQISRKAEVWWGSEGGRKTVSISSLAGKTVSR